MLLLFCLCCVPEVGPPASVLVAPRVLAVRVEPAEVAPGDAARLNLYVAEPGGGLSLPSDSALRRAQWALCLTPKPPVDNNFVSERCLIEDSASSVLSVRGPQVEVPIPPEACALFGPQTPPTPAGQPPARPREPDATGGYYQPVRVRVAELGLAAIAGIRIRCGLPYASPEIAAAYRNQYIPNRNPEISSLSASSGDSPLTLASLPAGAQLTLRLLPQAGSAEPFILFSPATQTLIAQQEALRVSWFADKGRFNLAATMSEVAGGAIANEWTAPAAPGPVLLYAVLRDSRGGVAVLQQLVQVR